MCILAGHIISLDFAKYFILYLLCSAISILTAFTCCIYYFQEVMQAPVVAADGYTYEHTAIIHWLETRGTSPMTNLALDNPEVYPNHALRSAIHDWNRKHAR